MTILIIAMMLGCCTGLIAKSKNRGFFAWWLYGTLIFIVAIVHVLIVKPLQPSEAEMHASGSRLCPHCAEEIQMAAVVCKHCHRDVPPMTVPSADLVADWSDSGRPA